MGSLCVLDGMHAGVCAKTKRATKEGDADEGGVLESGDWAQSNPGMVGC